MGFDNYNETCRPAFPDFIVTCNMFNSLPPGCWSGNGMEVRLMSHINCLWVILKSLSHMNDMYDVPVQDMDPGHRLTSQMNWDWMDAAQDPWGQSQ